MVAVSVNVCAAMASMPLFLYDVMSYFAGPPSGPSAMTHSVPVMDPSPHPKDTQAPPSLPARTSAARRAPSASDQWKRSLPSNASEYS